MLISFPFAMVIIRSFVTPNSSTPAKTFPFATWYNKISCKTGTFSGCNKHPSNSSPNFAKASFEGAKTVSGPGLGGSDNNSTMLAACKAATNVVKPKLLAVVGISSVGGDVVGGSVATHCLKNPGTSKPGGTRTLSMA